MGSLSYASDLTSRDFNGVGGNPLAGDRSLSVAHDSRVSEDTRRGVAPYTQTGNMEISPYQGWPHTHDTLATARKDAVELVGEIMQLHQEKFEGWWAAFAAVKKLPQKFDERVMIYITDPAVMERAAELTVPNLLQFRQEEHLISLARYHHGFDMYLESMLSPNGAKELALKAHSAIQNAELTKKLLVTAAAIDADEVTLRHYRRTTKWRDIDHFTKHDRKVFGCIQKNPVAIQMLMSFIEVALSTNPRRPQLDMAVMAKKSFHQLRFGHPRNYEVYRAGQPMVDRVLKAGTSQEFAQDLFPYPLYADEKVNPINSNSDLPIEALKRQATLGAYAVLEHDDDGPLKGGSWESKTSYRLPTIQCVTMPKNDFENFTVLDGLLNDMRFGNDEDGTIYESTRDLIDSEGGYSDYNGDSDSNRHRGHKFGRGHHVKDLFVYQPNLLTGMSGQDQDSRPRVCEFVGEMDPDHLPQEYIEKQALRAMHNVGLTDSEKAAITAFLQAAKSLRESKYLLGKNDADRATALNVMWEQLDKGVATTGIATEQGNVEAAQRKLRQKKLIDDATSDTAPDPDNEDETIDNPDKIVSKQAVVDAQAELDTALAALDAKIREQRTTDGDVVAEPMYGGPKVLEFSEVARGELVVGIPEPVGHGDLFSLLSHAKQAASLKTSYPGWPWAKVLDFETASRGIEKILAFQSRAFYKCGLNDETALPMFRSVEADRSKLLASMRGPFERACHGIWRQAGSGTTPGGPRRDATNFVFTEDLILRAGRTASAGVAEITEEKLTAADTKKAVDEAYQNAQAVASTFVKIAKDLNEAKGDYSNFADTSVFARVKNVSEFVQQIVGLINGTGDTWGGGIQFAAAGAATINHFLVLVEEGRTADLANTKKEDLTAIYEVAKRAVDSLRAPTGSLTPTEQPTTRTNIATKEYLVTRLTLSKNLFTDKAKIGTMFFGTNAAEGTDAPIIFNDDSANDRFARARMSRYAVENDAAFVARMEAQGVRIEGQFRDNRYGQMDARRTRNVGGLFQVINDYVYDEGESDKIVRGKSGQWLAERQHVARRVSEIQSRFPEDQTAESAIGRYFAYSMVFLHICRRSFEQLVFNNLSIPMNYMFAWTGIRVDTQALLLAQGGADTCRLNYAYVMTSKPVDGAHRTELYNMSVWMGAKVIDPSKVIIIPDVGMDGYRGGMGKTFVTSYDQLSGKHRKDIVAMGVPITFTRDASFTEQHNPLPLFGFHDSEYYNGTFTEKDRIFSRTPHFDTWAFYNHHLRFQRNINATAEKPIFSNFKELRKNQWNPGTLWHRRTRTYNSEKGKGVFDYSRGTIGSGHLDELDPERINVRAALDGEVELRYSVMETRGYT